MSEVFQASSAEVATLTNVFSVDGVPTDPTTVTLVVTNPAGTATTYTLAAGSVTRTAAGTYTRDVACSMSGTWRYLWVGTGAASDAQVGTWQVSGGVPDLAEIKAYLTSVGGTSYSDADVADALDEEIALQISACGDRTGDYPAPLAGALKRRVARNLAMRPMTLGYLTGGEVAQRVAGFDLEIRRKEGPYRRLVTG